MGEGQTARKGDGLRLIYVNSAAVRMYVRQRARRRDYTYVHIGGPQWGPGASFVECGLILMGTDDKQRKQASSLPGEICLLLPRVQWGLYPPRVHIDVNDAAGPRGRPAEAGRPGTQTTSYVDLFRRTLGSVGHIRSSSGWRGTTIVCLPRVHSHYRP